jgi:hypothetical protein
MSTPQEQVQCLLWLAELQSLMAVQRRFRTQYGCQPPTRKSIRFWDNKLMTTGDLLRVKSYGKTRISEENVNRIREAFQRSPRKSMVLHVHFKISTFNSHHGLFTAPEPWICCFSFIFVPLPLR